MKFIHHFSEAIKVSKLINKLGFGHIGLNKQADGSYEIVGLKIKSTLEAFPKESEELKTECRDIILRYINDNEDHADKYLEEEFDDLVSMIFADKCLGLIRPEFATEVAERNDFGNFITDPNRSYIRLVDPNIDTKSLVEEWDKYAIINIKSITIS